jgi:phenylalanyl-tRNA synthetase beta chain
MYISYNWLKDFVKLPAKVSPEEIAEALTAHTVEVEGLVNQADKFKQVVIGKVLEVKKHPNADRLRLTVVNVGDKQLNIVCGAPNVAAGQMVPVALSGALLPNGVEIKTSEIRGEKSEGMICAEDELGLGKNHEGIMVLGKGAKIGESFAQYLKFNDIIFEVDNKSLSNRPDLLSHYGLARELAVIFDSRLKPYDKVIGTELSFPDIKDSKLTVAVENKDICPRYMAVRVDNIKVDESPIWLKERLVAINQRPINNIVDLTNYVMFETGQPLHAFNAALVKKIVVKTNGKQEAFETLDGKERILNADDLVISDGQQALAIAGVMGGKNSEVDETTTAIILESANFKAAAIRKTAQRLGLRTEASVRFEKSLDPNLAEDALKRFLTLLKGICPELKITGNLFDLGGRVSQENKIDLEFSWLFSKIGQEISKEQVVSILSKLGFQLTKHKDSLNVTVPSWRATKDIRGREDLVEEILRIYGYDNITSVLPTERMAAPVINQERLLERKIKDILCLKFNLSEVYNYSFVGEEQLKKINVDFFNYLKLANPLSEIHSMLRQSLVPGLVYNVKNNQFRYDSLGFFETGSVFFNAPGDFKKDNESEDNIPYQEKRLGLALAGNNKDIFSELKSIVVGFLHELVPQNNEIIFSRLENFPGWTETSLAAKILVFDQELGLVGVLNTNAEKNLNLKMKSGFVEINLEALFRIITSLPSFYFQETAKYPAVMRDLAFVVLEDILYNDIKKEISDFNPLISSVELFDVYAGDKLAAHEKSLAFHINYQSPDRTLTSAEVDSLQTELVNHLIAKFEAKLRDF